MNDKTNLIDSVQSLRDRWVATTRHDGHDGDFDILLEVIAALKKPRVTPWDQELIAKDARIAELTAEVTSLRDALMAIRVYANDTLSGPVNPTDDTRDWQRSGVIELLRRARNALKDGV